MKQIIYHRYGGIDVLEATEVPVPVPLENQLLITVKAVAINPLDWKLFEGQMKFVTGSKFPRGVGIEFSGVVALTGHDVRNFKVGEAVFGMLDAFKGGALAEQLIVTEKQIHAKPPALSFEQAAALPIGGMSALQILDDLAQVQRGTEILINGATGGVGAFATQIAKQRGAIVTAVTSTRGVPLVEKWRSNFVVDYKKDSILSLNKRFDVVVDLSGTLPFSAARSLLKPTSVYVNALPNPKDMLVGFFHNLFSGQKRRILMMKVRPDRLAQLCDYATDWLEVVVGSTSPLAAFKQAYADAIATGAVGKSVITTPANTSTKPNMITAKNLTQEPARSPRIRIGGYVLLARMADKGRATINGTAGEYHFDCPVDNLLFGFKGVKGSEVKPLLASGASDDEIAAWFDTHGTPKTAAEITAWGDSIVATSPYNDPAKREWFIGVCEPLGLKPETATFCDFLDADDRASFPAARGRKVLIIGLDPAVIDFSSPDFAAFPGLNAARIMAGLTSSQKQLTTLGYEVDICLTDYGATAAAVATAQLRQQRFDCVMIGAGIRALPSTFMLFEKLINVVHEHAPAAKICFNTNPTDTPAAVQRWI